MNLVFKNTIGFTLLFVVFSVKKCLMNLIDETEFESLRESMKHHLQSDKIIKKIPHECSDRPNIEIDMVFKEDNLNGSIYFVVYANKKYYIIIDGITRDHLPIVHRNRQPIVVDTKFLMKMTGKNSISEYKFIGPLYLYKLPNEKGKYSLIGFNQVWIGCPQPMCISPGIDAVLSPNFYGDHYYPRFDSTIVIFRGNYFWHFDMGKDSPPVHPPLTDMALKIDDRWVDRRVNNYNYNPMTKQYDRSDLNDSMVVPTYMDAIVPGINRYNNCIYFFKNEDFVCYQFYTYLSTPLKIATEWKSPEDQWKSAKIDAAFHIKSLIYFIAGSKIWCFTSDHTLCLSYPKNLVDLHEDFPTDITSAFQMGNNIYIIKGLLYYKFSASGFPMKIKDEEMVGKYLFKDLFGCDDGLYTAWGFDNYDNFIEKIAKKMQTGISITRTGNMETNFNPTFLIISVITLTLSLSIFITIWHLKPIWITKFVQILKMPFS